MAPKNRTEYRAAIADMFVKSLEEKGLEWKRGWDLCMGRRPYNAATGREYHGINRFYLSQLASERGYTDPRWATMLQIMDRKGEYHPGSKWHLQAGSKAVYVEYWYPYDNWTKRIMDWTEYRALPPEERSSGRYSLRTRYTPVFHASMIDGMPPLPKLPEREPQPLSEVVRRLSEIMGVTLIYDGFDRAFYRPSADAVHLPLPEQFHDGYEFNVTVLHELTHATGHESRLRRDLSGHFASEEYAYEELVAEIGSCFMSCNAGAEPTPAHLKNHKAYVQAWIARIREKPETLARAITDAQRAALYMDRHAGLISEREYAERMHNAALVPGSAQKGSDTLGADRAENEDPFARAAAELCRASAERQELCEELEAGG